MKKSLLIISTLVLSFGWKAQDKSNDQTKPIFTSSAIEFGITEPLRDLPAIRMEWEDGKIPTIQNKLRRNKYVNEVNALPQGNDPVWQKDQPGHFNKAPIQNWVGSTNFAYPPDPSGAVGPNHYVQMVNSEFTIYDKVGNILYGPATLGSLLGGGNDGDPIVMYDVNADRWFLSQFKSSNNSLQIAVSQTADPTGAYYTYAFPLGSSFPDYPKYSVWGDGYYVTSNKSGEQCYALERDKMILGDVNAQIVGFSFPQLATGGFFSVIPANATDGGVTPGTPNYMYYFQDDAWGGVSQDHIKIWEVSIDWTNTANSTISTPQSLNVSAFDSQFQSNWNDIEQPGTSSKLDGIPGAFMYMGQYREFSGYQSVVLNHTVDVDGTDHGGIRWYELRKTGANPWTVYQEGTFAPDAESRWLGSICMDYQGNIGLAYSVSGPTVYPSIRYTGRYYYDPLGQMTLTETDIVAGTGVQTGTNRWGDYAQMTIDPTDDATFWYTGEYIAGGRKTRIASFKIANDFNDDVGVATVDSPVDGVLTATEAITVTIMNFGVNSQSNIPVSYTVNGGTAVNETYTGTIASGASAQYTFAQTADMSLTGNYNIVAYTSLGIDQFNGNDTTAKTVKHLFSNDIGATVITSPASGSGMTAAESVIVTLENFGATNQTGFPVSYTINGGTPVTETYSGTLTAGSNAQYTFTQTADLSVLGTYDFVAYTGLAGDSDNSNDTTSTTVDHHMCMPTADCSYGDGFTLFKLASINKNSTCSANGYADYTITSTNLEQSATYNLTLKAGGSGQSATVWIDYNDNFSFESNEILKLNMHFGSTNTTDTVTIPANAALGSHLMRAKAEWSWAGNANVSDPCTDMTYGETEDYTVNIIAFTGVDEKYQNMDLVVNPLENGKFNVMIDGMNEPVSIEIHNTIGQKVYNVADIQSGSSLNYTLDLSGNAIGYYLIKVSNANFSKVKKIALK